MTLALKMSPLLVCAALLYFQAPWWSVGIFGLPALIIMPGWGFVRRLSGNRVSTQLQLLIESMWLSLAICWSLIATLRETGLGQSDHASTILLSAIGLITFIGLMVGRKHSYSRPSPTREKRGLIWVLVAFAFICVWKHDDLGRTLDQYWYLEDADDERNEHVPLKPSRGWTDIQLIGDLDAHAMSMQPTMKNPDFIAKDRVNGRVILAVRGPIGSTITAGGESNTVKQDMSEGVQNGMCHWDIDETADCPAIETLNEKIGEWGPGNACPNQDLLRFDGFIEKKDTPYGKELDDEGNHCLYDCTYQCPVPRYLNSGIAAISVWVDLQPGEYFGIDLNNQKDVQVYLLPSVDAVWAAHASGEIKYTHHYQILNQVENQRWADEILVDRRFTWNQPPGWSPLLSMSGLIVSPDMNGAGSLFIWVTMLIGLSALRLTSLIAPHAPSMSGIIIAMMMLAHTQLMTVPGSINFPDSLYTAAIIGIVISLKENAWKRFALIGIVAQSLRWPGACVALLLWLSFRWRKGEGETKGLIGLGILIVVGILIAAIAMMTGDAEDLLFILYFETFPEHWHDNYDPLTLLSRTPEFYGKWLLYTGGSLALIVPFTFGNRSNQRLDLQAILIAILAYSTLLATIDHHPSHYFLPLAALTAPCLIAAADLSPHKMGKTTLIALSAIGYGAFLWNGVV